MNKDLGDTNFGGILCLKPNERKLYNMFFGNETVIGAIKAVRTREHNGHCKYSNKNNEHKSVLGKT